MYRQSTTPTALGVIRKKACYPAAGPTVTWGGAVFSLKRKGDYRLQLTRTLKKPGRHQVELYLFTPHESNFSARTLAEEQFFFSALTHRFGLLGLPTKDRASKADTSFSLLSPHYEIMYGSWFFQYLASMERLRQQLQSSGATAEPISRALRLSQNFAQRLRNACARPLPSKITSCATSARWTSIFPGMPSSTCWKA